VEVNVSGESSKHGFTPDELRQAAPALLSLPGVRVQGLMTMAPLVAEQEDTRPVFRELRELAQSLEHSRGIALPMLSMGMSNDFEAAIAEGATHVRIGRAIFGG
jgi:uncharacterized pyridoxal phosphate-containing UPF0001 family protein